MSKAHPLWAGQGDCDMHGKSRGTAPGRPATDGGQLEELMRGLSGARVLVVDDNQLSRYATLEMLALGGMETTAAGSGRQALEMLGHNDFDAVLLDIQMPEMDGFEVLRAIRQLPGGQDLPVVAMTGRTSSDDRQRCFEAGMNDHLAKPLDTASLFAALRQLILHRASAGSDPKSMDTKQALSLLMGNRELYARLLQGFLRDYAGAGQRMRDLASRDQTEEAVMLAHSIKGLAANLGGEKLSRAALEVETALRSGDHAQVLFGIGVFEQVLDEFLPQAEQTVVEMIGKS